MDRSQWAAVRRLFDAALDQPTADRAAWLAAQPMPLEVRAEVTRLLASDAAAAVRPPSTAAFTPATLIGQRLGSYTLVRWLGAGGMGAVFEAVEEHPRRRVAVKTLGTGAASGPLRRRFEDEVEILARLRHPHIAQVLGAGTWQQDGLELPWFAMELVESPQPLDRYVQHQGLDLRATVQMFGQVCSAVHFAHQKGVIHRDLKPANVLVDVGGAPKVIDFGIARLVDDAARAARTVTGEVFGTLAYMSPERLAGEAGAADTGSDVYALGVMLYELVTGTQPIALDGLAPAQAVEGLRTQEPPPPSVRAPERSLPRDLDWIVLRAMARERAHRYASVAELAADLQRLLRDEPVLAGPPSTLYRLRKLARRHRLALTMAALLLTVLLVGAGVAVMGWVQAAQAGRLAESRRVFAEQQVATLAQVNDLQRQILGAGYVDRGGRDVRLSDLLDQAAQRVDQSPPDDADVTVGLRTALGVSYLGLGLLAEAEQQLLRADTLVRERKLAPLAPTTLSLWNNLGLLRDEQGQLAAAEELLRRALDGHVQLHGEGHEQTATTLCNLASVLAKAGRPREALALAERAAATFAAVRGAASAQAITARNQVAAAQSALGEQARADASFPPLLQLVTERLGNDHPATNAVRSSYAAHLRQAGRKAEYAALSRAIAESHALTRGAAHPGTLVAFSNVAAALLDSGDLDGAVAMMRQVVATRERAGLLGGFDGILARQNLAFMLRRQGQLDAAETLLATLRAEADTQLPKGHWLAAMLLKEQGACRRDRGDFAGAETPLLQAARALERQLGPADYRVLRTIGELVALYEAWGRPEAAVEWRAKLPAK